MRSIKIETEESSYAEFGFKRTTERNLIDEIFGINHFVNLYNTTIFFFDRFMKFQFASITSPGTGSTISIKCVLFCENKTKQMYIMFLVPQTPIHIKTFRCVGPRSVQKWCTFFVIFFFARWVPVLLKWWEKKNRTGVCVCVFCVWVVCLCSN